MEALLYLLVFIIALVLYVINQHLKYDDFSRAKYGLKNLREDAKIINISCKATGRKVGALFRTVVEFDDGFTFMTHYTKVENFIFNERISVTPEMQRKIIAKAISHHENALLEKYSKGYK